VRRGDVSPAELLDLAISRVEARTPSSTPSYARCPIRLRAAIHGGLADWPFTGVPYCQGPAHLSRARDSLRQRDLSDFVGITTV